MVKVLNVFDIDYWVIYDIDRKGFFDVELEEKVVIYLFKVNVKILNIVMVDWVFLVEDIFEYVFWD